MVDPFRITGPTCISFSGGRTSAYMLWRVLQAHDMSLPDDVQVLFCNTGKEDNATLDFVRDCSEHWNIPITWLEYREGASFEVVSYEKASRNGEPFDAVIRNRHPALPNGRSRYCSSELKTRTMHRYLRFIGFEEWDTFIGIRADEPKRVAKFRANPHPETKSETVHMPLVPAALVRMTLERFGKAKLSTFSYQTSTAKQCTGIVIYACSNLLGRCLALLLKSRSAPSGGLSMNKKPPSVAAEMDSFLPSTDLHTHQWLSSQPTSATCSTRMKKPLRASAGTDMPILPNSDLEPRIAERIQERRDQGHAEHAEALRRQFWAILGQFYRGPNA